MLLLQPTTSFKKNLGFVWMAIETIDDNIAPICKQRVHTMLLRGTRKGGGRAHPM